MTSRRPADQTRLAMAELADFVLARIAEEEHDWIAWVDAGGPSVAAARARLTDCRARRDRLQQFGRQSELRSDAAMAEAELQRLALPYYDHPNYEPGWRPPWMRDR